MLVLAEAWEPLPLFYLGVIITKHKFLDSTSWNSLVVYDHHYKALNGSMVLCLAQKKIAETE